jgi:hypothetical protein
VHGRVHGWIHFGHGWHGFIRATRLIAVKDYKKGTGRPLPSRSCISTGPFNRRTSLQTSPSNGSSACCPRSRGGSGAFPARPPWRADAHRDRGFLTIAQPFKAGIHRPPKRSESREGRKNRSAVPCGTLKCASPITQP